MDDVLRQLQLAEYCMLKDVASFCEENDIQYFIDSGTLLGAVRHGGFIPWDDDIDIAMDYKNYKKFLQLAEKGLSKKYFVQNYKTDPKVNFPWTKIRINNTTSMDPRLRNYDIHLGICMDVFLINGISDNTIKRRVQKYFSKSQRRMLKKYYYIEGDIPNKNSVTNRVFPESLRRCFIRLFDRIINLDLSKTKKCYNTFYSDVGEKTSYMSEWFLTPKKIKFENREFYATLYYEEFLKEEYGDWKTLPPENERTAHGDIIVDFDNDYSLYWGDRLKLEKERNKK